MRETSAINPNVLGEKAMEMHQHSFTSFQAGAEIQGLPDSPISLDAVISVPGVPTGLGALLFVKRGFPNLLEIHTFGNELWDGISVGFDIPEGL
jgi:hypothetical protein